MIAFFCYQKLMRGVNEPMKKEMQQQIDLNEYQKLLKKNRSQILKKKCPNIIDDIPFCYLLFRKAYCVLRNKGIITRTDILEGRTMVDYEVYEALYMKTLRIILNYCRCNFDDISDLADMYEKEYDFMLQRRNSKQHVC